MKINFYLPISYFFSILLVCSLFFISCEKIPGHTVDPLSIKNSGSSGTGTTGCSVIAYTGATPNSNGIGNIAVGATNTIIFQVNNDNLVTILPSAYPYVAFFQPTGSATNGPLTVITAINNANTSGNNVDINYNSLTTGIYNAEILNIAIPPYDLVSVTANAYLPAMGTEKFNITSQNVTGTTTGTVKGTFDGFMVDSCMNKFRVSGSFNISK
jgi:hypothetical protein